MGVLLRFIGLRINITSDAEPPTSGPNQAGVCIFYCIRGFVNLVDNTVKALRLLVFPLLGHTVDATDTGIGAPRIPAEE